MGKGQVLVEKQVVEGRGRFLGACVNDYIDSDGYIVIDTCSEKMAPDNQNGLCPPPPVSLSRPTPFPSPSLLLALVNFEPNISRIYTLQLKSWVSLLRSMFMKMEWIESSETSALKAYTLGDYPKDTIWNFTLFKELIVQSLYLVSVSILETFLILNQI